MRTMETGNATATALCNHGVSCIQQGDYLQASEYLVQAFRDIRAQCSQAVVRPRNTCAPLDSVDTWMLEQFDQSSLGDFVYLHPIHIPSADKHEVLNEAVAISFNLALVYQIIALQCMEEEGSSIPAGSTQRLMRQSLKLYQCTIQMQRSQTSTTDSPMLYMVTINNIGILYSRLGEHGHASECFHHLLTLLMYRSTTGRGHPSCYEAFFGNASRLSSDSGAIGAGAA